MENDKSKNTLPRWEVVLLSIYAIIKSSGQVIVEIHKIDTVK